MNPFDITTPAYRIELDQARKAKVRFTVHNSSGQRLHAQATAISDAGIPDGWLHISRAQRVFRPDATHQITVDVKVADTAEPGRYSFRLRMVADENPDENWSESPSVEFEVLPMGAQPPSPKRKPFPWWIVIAVAATLLLVAVITVVATRGGEPAPSPTMSPAPRPVEIADVLDAAVAKMKNRPADWEVALNGAITSIGEERDASLIDRLTQLRDRAASVPGDACQPAFVGEQVTEDVLRIRADLGGGEYPAPRPAVCAIKPDPIDMTLAATERTKLDIFGYGLDITPALKAFLLDNNQRTDVSQHLATKGHFHVVLALGSRAGGGVPLSSLSQKIELRWNAENIGDVLMAPQPRGCQTTTAAFTPEEVLLVPNHTAGDADFWGHGPSVSTDVTLLNQSTRVEVKVHMVAIEGGGDTQAEGQVVLAIFPKQPPLVGKRILKIDLAALRDDFTYVDTDHEADVFTRSSGQPVREYDFIGDTSGSEAGTKTRVIVRFNSIPLTLVETQDCLQ